MIQKEYGNDWLWHGVTVTPKYLILRVCVCGELSNVSIAQQLRRPRQHSGPAKPLKPRLEVLSAAQPRRQRVHNCSDNAGWRKMGSARGWRRYRGLRGRKLSIAPHHVDMHGVTRRTLRLKSPPKSGAVARSTVGEAETAIYILEYSYLCLLQSKALHYFQSSSWLNDHRDSCFVR